MITFTRLFTTTPLATDERQAIFVVIITNSVRKKILTMRLRVHNTYTLHTIICGVHVKRHVVKSGIDQFQQPEMRLFFENKLC